MGCCGEVVGRFRGRCGGVVGTWLGRLWEVVRRSGGGCQELTESNVVGWYGGVVGEFVGKLWPCSTNVAEIARRGKVTQKLRALLRSSGEFPGNLCESYARLAAPSKYYEIF